ncbi:S35C2 protein, partial [Polypterus senegalus]
MGAERRLWAMVEVASTGLMPPEVQIASQCKLSIFAPGEQDLVQSFLLRFGQKQLLNLSPPVDATHFFFLICGIIEGLEHQKPCLIVVVLLIAGGLFMFTFESTQFNLEGFLLVLLASFLGGIRWTLTQILMQKAELGLSLSTSEKLFRVSDMSHLLHTIVLLSLGGALAFGLGFSEFLLVSKTSGLTLSIAGIFKEICTLLLASHLMGDEMSTLNWLGFAVCLSGISLHVSLKSLGSKGKSAHRLQVPKESNKDLELPLLREERDEANEEDDDDDEQEREILHR